MGTVWVLRVDHRHGADVTVHSSVAAAKESLREWVHSWWDETAGRCGAPDAPPDNPDEAIQFYFEAMAGEESYAIDEAEMNP